MYTETPQATTHEDAALPPEQLSAADVTIRPLTFVQVCQAAGRLAEARRAQAALTLRAPLQVLSLPLVYHWATSGYGAFYGEQPVGWLFLRGWPQVLVVEALVVPGEWQQRGVEPILLAFAVEQARELQRQWLGLTALLGDAQRLEFYRALGFACGHWRVMRRERPPESPAPSGGAPSVRRAAQRACQDFARLDVGAADAQGEAYLAGFLSRDPYCRAGRSWLVMHEGQPIACLNQHQRAGQTTLYLASAPEWWGSTPLLDAISVAPHAPGAAPGPVELRLGSSGHHDAARAALEALGFTERPAAIAPLFKRVPDGAGQRTTANGCDPGG